MKKTFITFVTLAVVGAGVQTARAGDKEWALAGKVLTGVAAAAVISHAIRPAPVYGSYSYAPGYSSYPAPVYSYCPAPAPRVVYVPAPRVVYAAPVYVARAPVVSFRFSGRGGYHPYRRGCW